MRRDGEEVLRETVVDLARDARTLLGDGPAELGVADRAPDADEQHPVCEQPQVVALRDTSPARTSGVKMKCSDEKSIRIAPSASQ